MSQFGLKRTLTSGLVVVFPVAVSVFALLWVYRKIAQIPMPFAQPWSVLVTITIFVLLVLSFGYLMRTTLGELFEQRLDDLMNRIPGFRVVYNASKMAVETTVSETDELQSAVKLKPWGDRQMTAFKTGKTTEDGRDILFLPTAPNITTGFVIEVRPDEYEEIDESIEEALTRILSAGFSETNDGQPAPPIQTGDDD